MKFKILVLSILLRMLKILIIHVSDNNNEAIDTINKDRLIQETREFIAKHES